MSTVESRVRLWKDSADYLDLDYALLRVHYGQSGERIMDRRGLLHRIAPEGFRYPCALTLSLLPEELSRLNAPGAVQRSALDWLEDCFRAQRELVLYCEGLSTASRVDSWGAGSIDAGPMTPAPTALARRQAYRCYLDELPPELPGSLAGLSGIGIGAATGSSLLDLGLTVTEDGSFGSFGLLTSYSAFSPPR